MLLERIGGEFIGNVVSIGISAQLIIDDNLHESQPHFRHFRRQARSAPAETSRVPPPPLSACGSPSLFYASSRTSFLPSLPVDLVCPLSFWKCRMSTGMLHSNCYASIRDMRWGTLQRHFRRRGWAARCGLQEGRGLPCCMQSWLL